MKSISCYIRKWGLFFRKESKDYNLVFFSISLTVGASKPIEAQMDLPRLLFGIGSQIFIVMPQMFMFS